MIKNYFSNGKILIVMTSLLGSQAFAAAGQQSFTPISVKVPIYTIAMSDAQGAGSQTNTSIYVCPGSTDAACLLDLADEAQMNAMATSAAAAGIKAGTYRYGSFSLCPTSAGTG